VQQKTDLELTDAEIRWDLTEIVLRQPFSCLHLDDDFVVNDHVETLFAEQNTFVPDLNDSFAIDFVSALLEFAFSIVFRNSGSNLLVRLP
jgi:hypothetical protein